MADRFVLKQFAGSATNNGAFGAAQATGAGVQPVANIKDVQSLNAFEQGWNSATLTADKLPALEEMQGLEALLCKAIKENYSEGIPFWISGETYYQDSRAVYNGKVYRNKTGSYTANNPATDTANWELDKPDTATKADTADKLGSSTVGSSTRGIYLDNGVPTPMSANFANDNLSNLTQTGEAHFCNPALTNTPYTTNRILEIPQDIKLELNDGTLTLKAGSKLYKPNGFETDGTTPKFDVVTLNNDISIKYGEGRSGCIPVYTSRGTIEWSAINSYSSGATQPQGDWWIWYDTNTNNIKFYDGSTIYPDCYLPLGLITENAGSGVDSGIKSIDQVFNGFGYIGSTVFVLPGVKYEYANGLNSDGSYVNGFGETTSVLTITYTYTTSTTQSLFIANDNNIWRCGQFFVVENPPTSGVAYCVWYVQSLNCFYSTVDGTTVPKIHKGTPLIQIASGIETNSSFRITNIDFEGVDGLLTSNANNLSPIGRSYLSGLGMPSNRYTDLTLGASGSTYTAPANGYFNLAKVSGGIEFINGINTNTSYYEQRTSVGVNVTETVVIPARKGDSVTFSYNMTGTTLSFRFIYAEGDK